MTTKPSYDLSVVIASYNRRDLLRRCLDSLAGQTQDPGTFEVIVADDGSSDGTADMAEGLEVPFRLRTLRLVNGGWASAQNAGIEAATGGVCLCLDDDIVASPQLVAEHVKAHEAGQSLVGIGKLVHALPKTQDWYAHAYVQGWNEHIEDRSHRDPTWKDCFGANLSAPRAALIETGGFATDIPSVEDVELGFRLVAAGCKLVFLPNAEAIHDDQKTVAQMIRDSERIGAAYVTVVERHPPMRSQALDWAGSAGPRALALRRLLIALRIRSSLLASLGRLLPGRGRKMVWLHFVQRFAFWRAVRQRVDRSRWRELTRAEPGGHGLGS
jgi:glycosyltransferase involved in cell wall biosynthesis